MDIIIEKKKIKEILEQYYFDIGKYNQGTNWFNTQDPSMRDKILLTVFRDALANKNHIVLWNIVQVYSMIEYNSINNISEQIIKLALINGDFNDVKEIALIAIENWENFSDEQYLKDLVFTDSYLDKLRLEILYEISDKGDNNDFKYISRNW